jgi:hypothetical protein
MKRIITSVRDSARLSQRGELERRRILEYMLDDLGPFIIELPESEFSWEKVK